MNFIPEKQRYTGRSWGDKKEPKLLQKLPSGKARVEFDTWDGPLIVGEPGQYIRNTAIVSQKDAAKLLGN